MQPPFTVEQFYSVFRDYNTTLWPVQVFLVVLALVAIALVAAPRRWSGVGVSTILAVLWAWFGVGYHLAFFTAISPLAYGFAAVCVAGSLFFVWQGAVRRRLEFALAFNVRTDQDGVLTAASKREMLSVHADGSAGVVSNVGVGLGWKRGRSGDVGFWNHEGGGAGYCSETRLYPESNLGVVILLNRSQSTGLSKVCHRICEHLRGALLR